LPASIWALGFVSLLMDVSSEMVHSLLPLFMVGSLGVSVAVVGLIEGLAEATALITKVFSGVISDYVGKRKVLAVIGYGLGALTKPLFALATGPGLIFSARMLDRVGKGIRGAPRDALVADITPPEQRGAAFGLRQALDTVGAFVGPLMAVGLMLLWANDYRAVFAVAVIPAALAVLLLVLGVREPQRAPGAPRVNPISRANLKRLSPACWWVVGIGAVFTLARFSEAFLVLRAAADRRGRGAGAPGDGGDELGVRGECLSVWQAVRQHVTHTPAVLGGLLVLIGADVVLALCTHWTGLLVGVALWGIHMGMTQGLLAAMVADVAPADLRGTAYGFFNLMSGLAMLLASVVAGVLWQGFGAPTTFGAGALFCGLAMLGLLARRRLAVAP
jgi:sugar phosphate permease